jgi:hypothetical protein
MQNTVDLRIKGCSFNEKISTIYAIIIGKCVCLTYLGIREYYYLLIKEFSRLAQVIQGMGKSGWRNR